MVVWCDGINSCCFQQKMSCCRDAKSPSDLQVGYLFWLEGDCSLVPNGPELGLGTRLGRLDAAVNMVKTSA